MKAVQRRSMFLVAILTVAWMAGQVGAAVVDLRAEARANPSLMHHYTFEGPHQGPAGWQPISRMTTICSTARAGCTWRRGCILRVRFLMDRVSTH